ncbi:MAG: ABC transporter permease [Firmicutes bacterium]|nr:ABC transporter permease [Bacillota bacterium]
MNKLVPRLIRRILGGIVMILAVASFTFFLIHMIPGNPVDAKLAQLEIAGVQPQQAMTEVHAMYGFMPHQPLYVQYVQYIWELLHLNLGKSITYAGVSVTHLLLEAMPWTVITVTSGIIVSFVFGILAGVIIAVYRDRGISNGLTLFSTFLHGIPQLILALLLAYLFTTIWAIFPYGSPYDAAIAPGFTLPFIGSLAWHAVLPVAAYAISSYGGWALTMKSSVISVLGDDFILASELRGLKPRIRIGYIARSAILPLFTTLTLSIGFMFGGSVFIEEIFDYRGLGYMLITATGNLDYPLMAGSFLIITVAVIVANIVADFLYTAIDPRIRV